MLIDQITPFVRFSAKQDLSHVYVGKEKKVAGYDHRIYFCVEGKGEVVVDGRTYELLPNTLVMWRAGTPYYYHSTAYDPFICITCNFDFTAVANDLRIPIPPATIASFDRTQMMPENIYFSDHKAFNDVVYIKDASFVNRLMVNLEEEYSKKLKFYVLKCNNILQQVLLSIAYHTDSDISNKNNELAFKILDYIRLNFRENLTNEDIGKVFGYHPNYINSLIVKNTGMSLHHYLLDCKLSYAMQLLLSSNKTISEIAEEIGIGDTQYFSRLFKKHYKSPPSSFRVNN